jgi:predicted ester cyclase
LGSLDARLKLFPAYSAGQVHPPQKIIEARISPQTVKQGDGSVLRGIDSFQEHVRQHREAFPDWKEEIQQIVAEGDLVVLHFVSTGTNAGSWRGSPATGRKIRIHEMSILRIEDGKIAEQWLLPSIFSMQQQLAGATDE